MDRPGAAAVTLPNCELVILVLGLFQRTKLNGFCRSARRMPRKWSPSGVDLAADTASLFCEKPRTQSSTLAVLPSWKVGGVVKADAFR